MHIRTFPTAETAASAAADIIVQALSAGEGPVLALPTGNTPLPLYRMLVARHQQGQADFSRATVFSMDELLGLAADHPGSYQTYLRQHLLQHVNLAAERTHLIRGDRKDWRAEARRIERQLGAVGGLDLAIIGIGMNGHVAFNEPAATLPARTHRVRLAPSSRRLHAGPFGRWQRVPTHALTMGIGTLLSARRVLLVATGAHKAGILRRALTGPVTTRVPASLLQVHPSLDVVLDEAAAGGSPRRRARTRGRSTRID